MTSMHRRIQLAAAISALALITTGCSMMGGDSGSGMAGMMGMSSAASMSGAQEVPANPSKASGTSHIKVAADKSVSGSVTYSGMTATMAHIHEAAKGANGGVIIPLTKVSDTRFNVPANAKLTDSQYASYQAGNLYVNVHSATYPGGEIRTQLSSK